MSFDFSDDELEAIDTAFDICLDLEYGLKSLDMNQRLAIYKIRMKSQSRSAELTATEYQVVFLALKHLVHLIYNDQTEGLVTNSVDYEEIAIELYEHLYSYFPNLDDLSLADLGF
jgi:hypothetical protein